MRIVIDCDKLIERKDLRRDVMRKREKTKQCHPIPPTPPPPFKQTFLQTLLQFKILKFGTFTLKSGRQSPYFFNAGLFNTGTLLTSLGAAYANTIHTSTNLPPFDVIFGPAYKGIPLATVALAKLYELAPERYGDVGYAFDRKEVKDHGEGGRMVGMELKGKRVLVVDDVITAGTAIRGAVSDIAEAGGTVVGIVGSAIMEVKKEMGVEVLAILTLDDLIVGVTDEGDRERMLEYRRKYRAIEE
ncbi:phosphoribosyltransferase-like protein [Tuber borchii]|uniref:Orotate phosphoribosyltransferase n=1 Tax=Tuber borchii TaxID=42251 RepID=A0A2T6ZKJ8_TUBBO|nr:phosphoribosyltransferase-like protein [Tuber borchii]